MHRIPVKTGFEIELMAEGGNKLAEIISGVLKKIKPGLCTLEINGWIEREILETGGSPSFKMVPRYHWASCIGLNDEVVHSIPRKDKIIKEGDLLKIDAGMFWKGFHTDTSWTTIVQSSPQEFLRNSTGQTLFKVQSCKKKFLEAGKEALKKAIETARPGNRVGNISLAIQETIETAGYKPVQVLTGHGIGRKLHEEPLIPCFLASSTEKTAKLRPGMVLAIEVIYAQGSPDLVISKDNWTISTKDGKISGLFEETIAVCENGPLVLTRVLE